MVSAAAHSVHWRGWRWNRYADCTSSVMTTEAAGRKRGLRYSRVVQKAVAAQKIRMAEAVWRSPA